MSQKRLSPRQRMINMMYLVLTAMLALNISKDILEALTRLNKSFIETVETVDKKNVEIYKSFEVAVSENPEKASFWNDKAISVREKSNHLYNFIENMKKELIEVSGGMDKKTNLPRKLDSREPPANYLLNKGNANNLKNEIETYKTGIIEHTENNKQLINNIEILFDTKRKKASDKTIDWEHARFEHFPLAAILAFLTDIQAKIRNTESDLISQLQNNISMHDIKISTVTPIVVPKSIYVTQGDEYEAQIYLAAFDQTQDPEIYINGKALSSEQISNGVGKYKVKASSIGEVKWKGKIVLKQIGADKTYDIPEQTFTIAHPLVVISPTKMNVLYRGVENPLEISVPGVDVSKLRVSGSGVSGSNGNYTAVVTKMKGKEMTISVAVEETGENGEKEVVNMGSKIFRIKGLPQAVGSIFGKTEGIMSKSLLMRAEVKAAYRDFPFDLPLQVISYQIAIPGFPPEDVMGNKISENIKQRINKLRPGSTVSVRRIKASGPKGLIVPNISNISIDVN